MKKMNMNLKRKLPVVAALFALLSAQAFALGGGNGSSGIGNMPVDDDSGLHAKFPVSQPVAKNGNTIIDPSSGEKLLQIDKVNASDLKTLYGDQLVQATLGAAHGFEVQPTRADAEKGAQNLWIVCKDGKPDNGSCVRLTPLSRTNPKVPAVVGALFQDKNDKAEAKTK